MSQVQISDVKKYANVFFTDDDSLFTLILTAARSFVSTYTGLPLSSAINGANIQTAIQVKYPDAVVTVTGNVVTITSGSTIGTDSAFIIPQIKNTTGLIVSTSTVSADNKTIVLNVQTCDTYESLTVALFVLCNEMYDNRDYSTDKVQVNFVVKQILDTYSVNYL